MYKTCYVNGRYLNFSEAKLHIEDRSTQFADGIYEVLRFEKLHLYFLEEHLNRMYSSLEKINLHFNVSKKTITILINNVISKNKIGSGLVYIQISRGIAPRNHAFPAKSSPSLIIYVLPLKKPTLEQQTIGEFAITSQDIRWSKCDIKSTSLLGNVLLKQEAKSKGAFEVIMHRDGYVTEGSSTNVFIVKNNTLITRGLDNYVLPGITRKKILECAKRNNIALQERLFTIEELAAADEVFISSTSIKILPITTVDSYKIGNGTPGQLTQNLSKLFSIIN